MSSPQSIGRTVLVIACVGAIVSASGCDVFAPEDEKPTAFWPVSAGDWWEFERRNAVLQGDLPEYAPGRVRLEVLRDTLIDGQHWSILNESPLLLNGIFGGIHLAGNRRGGFWYDNVAPEYGDPEFRPALSFPYPAAVGTRFWGPYLLPMSVAVQDEEIEVPAGRFRCYRYDAMIDGWRLSYWIAPGVGVVQVQYFPVAAVMGDPAAPDTLWDTQTTDALVDYHVGAH